MHSKVKIWYALCFLFSIYNLKLLVDDRNEVNYIMVDLEDELYSNETVHTICISFAQVKSKSRLHIEATGNVSIAEFLRHSMASVADVLQMAFPDRSLFDLTRGYVNNQQVCFPHPPEAVNSNFFKRLIKTYPTFFYVHSPTKQPFSSEYFYLKYDRLEYLSMNMVTRIVYGEKYLTSTECSPSDRLAKSRFFCLNSCYKQIERSEFIFYAFDEDATLDLNLIQPGGNLTNKNQPSARPREEINKECFKRCPNVDCSLEIYFSANTDSHPDLMGDPPENRLSEYKIIYQAFYSLEYFWLQLIGLATLLTGTSLTGTLPAVLALLYDSVKFRFATYEHFRYYQRYFPKFRFALLVFSLLFFIAESVRMYQDYRHDSLYPNRTRIANYTSEIEPFTLIICLALPDELQSSLAGKSVEEVGRLTKRLLRPVQVNLLYGNKEENFKYSVSKKLLFKTETFTGERLTFRCFRLDFTEFYLLKYRRSIPFLIIQIRFNTTSWRVYLTEREQPLVSSLVPLYGANYFEQDIYRYAEVSAKSNCKDYAKDAELNCISRKHCVDRCYNRWGVHLNIFLGILSI